MNVEGVDNTPIPKSHEHSQQQTLVDTHTPIELL